MDSFEMMDRFELDMKIEQGEAEEKKKKKHMMFFFCLFKICKNDLLANAVRPPLPTAPPRAVGRQECSCPPEVPPAPNSDALAAALEGPFYDLEKYVQPRKAKWTHHCPRLGLFLTSSQNEYFC